MSYSFFAEYYDFFTANINYRAYAARLRKIAGDLSARSGRVLDLGCGTGSLSLELARLGFNVTGIDLSESMIEKAKLKEGSNVGASGSCRFIGGDITLLPEYIEENSCSAAFSSMDVLNHLADFESVERVFAGVRRVLRRGGVFIFDMNTIYKHRHVLADNCFIFDSDRAYLGWQNDYNDDDSVRITLDFFVPQDGCFKRRTESFTERAYPAKRIAGALEANGMRLQAMYDGLSEKSPRKTTQRVMYVSVKK